jgi:nitrogen fixation protein NifU and related proteins
MADKRALYEQVILDHNKKPRNFQKLDDATHEAEGYNALCGDQFKVYLKMDGDRIVEAAFHGAGCAISKSSASVMTSMVKGKTRKEAEDLFKRFHTMVASDSQEPANEALMGKLMVFSGVREYPVRIKCATLPWHTLLAALDGKKEKPVTTE